MDTVAVSTDGTPSIATQSASSGYANQVTINGDTYTTVEPEQQDASAASPSQGPDTVDIAASPSQSSSILDTAASPSQAPDTVDTEGSPSQAPDTVDTAASLSQAPDQWETANSCSSMPSDTNSVLDQSGRLWGWENSKVSLPISSLSLLTMRILFLTHCSVHAQSCAYKSTPQYENAPRCGSVGINGPRVEDNMGRLWGWENNASCVIEVRHSWVDRMKKSTVASSPYFFAHAKPYVLLHKSLVKDSSPSIRSAFPVCNKQYLY